tara:strand:+ start:228 stop:425 length:198 start_codon:yes stop_codon:yes gene_type:complete
MYRVSAEQMANLKKPEFETVVYYLRKHTNSRREDNISVEDFEKLGENRYGNGFVYFRQEIRVLKR